MAQTESGLCADLVLEGGGVKGLGTAGAVIRLLEAGYRIPRAAGTSVGALAAAVVATGVDANGLREVMGRLELRKIPDRRAPRVPLLSEGVSLLSNNGAYQGKYIRDWLYEELRRLGVVTFGDLRRSDVGADENLQPDQRYALVVMVTDVTKGRLLRLPWDYHLFHLEPDKQIVADAVRMSLSIPFFFEPCSLKDPLTGDVSVIVDGGLLSNFPVEVFDRTDGQPSRWPSFGVRIIPTLPEGLVELFPAPVLPMIPPLLLAEQVLTTVLVGRDQTHLDRPGVRGRMISIDTSVAGVTEFGISTRKREQLLKKGWEAADAFLKTWNPGTL
jgi:NTE family protein